MKFAELQDLADQVSDKIGKPVCIGMKYWNFQPSKQLRYEYYSKDDDTIEFKTVRDLRSHMEFILFGKDEEVEIE